LQVTAAVLARFGLGHQSQLSDESGVAPQIEVSVKQIGDALMTQYVLPLEVIACCCGGLIGAVIIAVKEERK